MEFNLSLFSSLIDGAALSLKSSRNLHFKLNTTKSKKKKLAYYSSCFMPRVVIFSAMAFTVVKAIANSSIGQTLQRRMLITKNASLQKSSYLKDLADKARQASFETLHARWTMLAALGALVPELLDLSGVIPHLGYTLDYLGIPGLHIAGSQGVLVIAICQELLMYARYCEIEPLGIYLPGDINYPGGGLFDPLGLSKDPIAFKELKVKEIKNGRLAMVLKTHFLQQIRLLCPNSFDRKRPIQNLLEHISDPLHINILSSSSLNS
ncbi:hypothetical protein MKX01_020222 [Papaver californicum]|nr:hypothetical protein MKX01_020222 [Papaver californicum]